MFQILNMGLLDICWGVPFLCLSILVMTCFFDALFRIRHITQTVESHKKERDLISSYLRSGNMIDAGKLIDSSRDPVVSASVSVLNAGVKKRFHDYGALKEEIKDVLNGILKVPHELIFDYFCAVILTVGFGGTTLSFFYLLANFDINTSDFSQLFRYLAVGIKSSFFGAIASILMSTGHVWLKKKVEAEKEMLINEDFHKNLIWIINSSLTEANGQTNSAGNNGGDMVSKQRINSDSKQLQDLTKRKEGIDSFIKRARNGFNQKRLEYASKPKLWQEIEERFTNKLSQMKKESCDIELQIEELEGAFK